jgi:hypothetical protein
MKKVKKLLAVVIAAMSVMLMAITASANAPASLDMEALVTATGATLSAQFIAMVGALMPVIVGIAVTGLGIYAIIVLFRLAKSLFAKAAG